MSLNEFRVEGNQRPRAYYMRTPPLHPQPLDKGQPLPKFGEWDVNDPASAEGFTVIFNKARDEKKTGGNPDSPGKSDPQVKHRVHPAKPASKKWFSCFSNPPAES